MYLNQEMSILGSQQSYRGQNQEEGRIRTEHPYVKANNLQSVDLSPIASATELEKKSVC